jgi:S1-C subfamily serine protease
MTAHLRVFGALGIVSAMMVVGAGTTGTSVAAAAGVDEPLQRAIDATVFVKVDRLYRGDGLQTTGTGFVIHEDGWVLTNAHVVSDTVTIEGQDQTRRVRSTVSGITVIIGSGGDSEREVNARVVARDTDLDLALLKIPGPVSPVLDVFPSDQAPALTDPVWIVGFPYGELLSMERRQHHQSSNPAPSVNLGRVSALRRDDDGELRHLQTDAAVNPGNSGGPMVDTEGRVVGVVFAKVGESGVGFAVSAEQVMNFIHTRGYKVRMNPPAIDRTSDVLAVNLESTFIPLGDWSGTVTVEGGGTKAVTRTLTPTVTGLRAVVPLGRTAATDASSGLLRTSIDLTTPDGSTVSRVFRVRGADTQPNASAARSDGDGESDRDEVDTAEHRGFGGLAGGRMSAARSESDGRDTEMHIEDVSADEMLSELRQEMADPHRYEAVQDSDQLELAKRYDQAGYHTAKLSLRARRIRSQADFMPIAQDAMNLISNLEVIQARLRTVDLCLCDQAWRTCPDPLPNECEQPRVEDDVSVLRELLTR